MNINPNHAYAVSAGATAVSWLASIDTILHVVASLIVIVSGLIAIVNFKRSKK